MKKRTRQFVKGIERNTKKIFLISIVLLLVLILINTVIINVSGNVLKEKVIEIEEFNRPLEIELFIINCNECSDISSVINDIKNKNVKVINEEILDVNSERAKEFISEYGITQIPFVLISGEIDNEKVTFNNFELKNNVLVLNKVNAPFLDLSSNQLKGLVEIVEIVDSSCEECISLSSIPLSFGKAGVTLSDWKKVEYNSVEGKAYVEKFEVNQIPTVLISKDINYYESIRQDLLQLNPSEKQGFYVLHSIIPPFRDLSQNKIVGLVDLIMLVDNSCNECYDTKINKQILQGFGMVINSENTYDISSSSGQQLISKYNIEKVPMILVSPEANAYDSFVQAWTSVGSVDNDGWYVMTSPEAVGKITLV